MRTNAAKKNFIALFSSFGINALVTLVSSPFLLTGLGEVRYGIWKTVQKMFDIASVADGRSGQTLKMIIARSGDDIIGKNKAISSAIVIWIAYLPVAIICMTGFYIFLPELVGGHQFSQDGLSMLFYCLALNFLLAPLITIPDAVLIGSNLGYRSIGIQVGGMIFTTLLSVLVIYLGWGLGGVGVATVTSGLLVALFMLILINKTFKWLKVVLPDKLSIRAQLSKTIQMNFWLLIEKGMLSGDAVIVAIILGPKVASGFSFMTFLSQMALALLLIMGSSLTPGVAGLLQQNKKRGRDIISISRNFIYAATSALVVVYVYGNEYFVKLWVGKEILLPGWGNLYLGFSLLLVALSRCDAQLQDVLLNIKGRIIHGIIGLAITALGAIFVANHFPNDIEYLLMALMTGKIYTSIAYSLITGSLYEIGLVKILKPVIMTFIGVLFYIFVKINFVYTVSDSYLALSGVIFACFVLYSILEKSTINYISAKFHVRAQ